MKRTGRPLTATQVARVSRPGRYGDGRGGHGLSLLVKPMKSSGRTSKTWSQRVRIGGQVRQLGLGSYPAVTLAEARRRAIANAQTAAEGGDPRKPPTPTLSEATEQVIALHRPNWKSGSKSEHQWRAWHRDYIAPAIGDMPVSEVTTSDVLRVILPIWSTRPVVAKRIRAKLSLVFRWAMAEQYRSDDPAEAVVGILPKRNGGTRHHAAIPHGRVAEALRTVRESGSRLPVKLAIEMVALTAARHGEVRGMKWNEIDEAEQVWSIPGERMKGGRSHRVPLSTGALRVLASARQLPDRHGSGLVFPMPSGKPIGQSAMAAVFARLDLGGTVHGIRSSFRDFCGEQGVSREVAESALAHKIGNAAEQAYARADLLERRRAVMEAWSRYISQ